MNINLSEQVHFVEPMKSSNFQKALVNEMELRITVKGRHTGKTYTTPVWFVHDGEKIFLLPVNGSDTNWYKNILADPNMTLTVGGKSINVKAKPTNEKDRVKETIDMFKAKYGADQIKRWYTKLDVSVEITLPP